MSNNEYLEGLKKLKAYFLEHDKTPFEHWAYKFIHDLLNSDQEDNLSFAEWSAKNYDAHFPLYGGEVHVWTYKGLMDKEQYTTDQLYTKYLESINQTDKTK